MWRNRFPLPVLALFYAILACTDGSPTGARAISTLDFRFLTPATVRSVRVEVSGPGIETAVVQNFSVGADSVAQGQVQVTAGSGRRIEVTAFDTAGVVTHRADTTLTLQAGSNPLLALRLIPLPATLGVVVTFGGHQVSVADTSSRQLRVGDTLRIVATGTRPGGIAAPPDSLVWGSSNTAILSVSGGLLTTHRTGQASVTVSLRSAAVRITVNVVDAVASSGWAEISSLGISTNISENAAFDPATGRLWVAPNPFTGVVRHRNASGNWSNISLSTGIGDCITLHYASSSNDLRAAQCDLGAVYRVALDGATTLLGPGAGGGSWFGAQSAIAWIGTEGKLLTTGGYGGCSQRGEVMAFGSAWAVRVPFGTGAPIPRGTAATAVDEARGKYYMFGGHGFNDQGIQVGCNNSSRRAFNDLWALDLVTNTWSVLIAPTPGTMSPPSSSAPTSEMAVCSARNELYIFITNTAADTLYAGSGLLPRTLYRYKPGVSTSLEPQENEGITPSAPRNIQGATLICDEPRNRLLLVQGTFASGQLLEWPLPPT